MGDRKARGLVEFSLIGSMILGSMVAIFGFVWLPAYEATTVNVILNADELRDPRLIEVVHRTHRYNESNQAGLVWPYRVLGIMIFGVASAGLIGLRRWKPDLWTSDPLR